ncbi:unnamed protein product [Urochloa decumbens]|uniref:DUF1618 domain-containing protein n=1 Tax=Urochloa decumbens TaxID=240449 RepID=A0ABC9GSQ8_9POAL
MSPPPPPSSSCGWAILGAIPRVSAAADEECCSLDLAPPPRVSILTVPKHVFPAEVTPRNYPRLLAADPSGLLLLHADQGRATSPTVIHQSFCWREFVAGYFVLQIDDASASASSAAALPLPEPDLIMNAGHVGIIASPAGQPGSYMVAELQPFLGDDHATLLCFSSDKVLALGGMLWWFDLSWCIVACDPFDRDPDLAVVPLPPAKALPYGQAAGVLDRYRHVAISNAKLRFVDMYRNRDPNTGALQVSVWTLLPTEEPASPDICWELDHRASFHDIWDHPTYKAAGLPTKIPVLALIHPDNPAVVYFFLHDHLFAFDLRDRAVVACDLYHLVDPPKDLVSARFVHAWNLPPPKPLLLSPTSPAPAAAGMAKEGTDSGPNDVGATASVDIY